jgi:UDP-N-acetylmuramoyl-L-alanyl-D-glutamate--2,6-diaminopimelate ligase
LFQQADKTRDGKKIGIVNFDDKNAKLFANDITHPLQYGRNGGDIVAENVSVNVDSVSYDVRIPENLAKIVGSSDDTKLVEKNLHIKTRIGGEFNVSNSLATVAVGLSYGLTKNEIEQGIFALTGIPGRMLDVDEGQDFKVIVDYAHTPDGFAKLFGSVTASGSGNIIALFGSAGRRDVAKRAKQGEIAGKFADTVILTEEDDRDVDGQEIMDQIAKGAEKAGKIREKDLFLIGNREEAMKFAFQTARKNDLVLLLGKGHEATIERADGEHPWDEVAMARKLLQKLTKPSA